FNQDEIQRELILKFRPYILSLQESLKSQIEQIKHDHPTDLDGNFYPDNIREALRNLIASLKRSLNTTSEQRAIQEIIAISTLNYLNKIVFLKYIEDKDPKSYLHLLKDFRISVTTKNYKRLTNQNNQSQITKQHTIEMTASEQSFGSFVRELKTNVLDKCSWFEIAQAAFSLEEGAMPKPSAQVSFDCFYPSENEVAELFNILKQYSFELISDYQIGDLYQEFLKICQQQQNLGAFYTPQDTVNYMIRQLDLSSEKSVIDPACGSGHFLEACILMLKKKFIETGCTESDAFFKALNQVWGNDIDPFAVQLSMIRLFFLGAREAILKNLNVFVFDTLAMEVLSYHDFSLNPLNPQIRFPFGRGTLPLTDYLKKVQNSLDETPTSINLREYKQNQFDCFIGNPPYGGSLSPNQRTLYRQIYRTSAEVYKYQLGSNDVYGFFIANAIKRVKNGGKICFLVSDTFLSLRSHYMLRRLILDTCEINEILLAPINLFRHMAISRTCIITLTKRLCEGGYKLRSDNKNWQDKQSCSCKVCQQRRQSKIRLVDRLRDQKEYNNPPSEKVQFIAQEQYEGVFSNPFWVNVPLEYVEVMVLANPKISNQIKDCWKYSELREHIEGGVGLQTGDNPSHLVILKDSPLWKKLQGSSKLETFRVMGADRIADLTEADEETLEKYRTEGISSDQFLVLFARNSDFSYWTNETWYIDWSAASVMQIKANPSARFQNTTFYFRRGFITDAHHGILKATLVENAIPAVNTNLYVGVDLESEFLLGYLNSQLASFFLGKIINTSLGGMSGHATPEDIRRLPIRLPTDEQTEKIFQGIKRAVIEKVTTIIKQLKVNPQVDISSLQEEVDDLIFGWFEFKKNDKKAVRDYIGQMEEEKSLY
ncbi:MAG: N-6 DNA methylase, partial [Candidatus Hodarchaeota archaeon]